MHITILTNKNKKLVTLYYCCYMYAIAITAITAKPGSYARDLIQASILFNL